MFIQNFAEDNLHLSLFEANQRWYSTIGIQGDKHQQMRFIFIKIGVEIQVISSKVLDLSLEDSSKFGM